MHKTGLLPEMLRGVQETIRDKPLIPQYPDDGVYEKWNIAIISSYLKVESRKVSREGYLWLSELMNNRRGSGSSN